MLRSFHRSRGSHVVQSFLGGALLLASLVPDLARGYAFSIGASNGGAALTPWVGRLDGHTDVIDYVVQPDGARVWTSYSETIATPPIPGETWFPRQLRGRHAMYQLIQFLVDWLCSSYYPSSPTALGELTGYDFQQEATATNEMFGIEVTTRGGMRIDALPALTGETAALDDVPFPYCLNTFVVVGSVVPAGPGFAEMTASATLPLFDGTSLVLAIQGRYAFDPTLVLPRAYAFECSGAFQMAQEEPQLWTLASTYVERAELVGTPSTPGVASHPLLAAAPNPLRAGTLLRYEIDGAAAVRLSVVDVRGRCVRRLVDRNETAGWHEAAWDGRDETGALVAAGIYWGRLDVAGRRRDQKLVVLR